MRDYTPPEIEEYGRIIRRLQSQPALSQHDREVLQRCRIAVARWACQAEGLPPHKRHLIAVLGQHAAEIMKEFPYLLGDMPPRRVAGKAPSDSKHHPVLPLSGESVHSKAGDFWPTG